MKARKAPLTYEEIVTKYEVSMETVVLLKRGLATCWQNIGGDVTENCGGEAKALKLYKNDEGMMVAESCLDADHIMMYGGEEFKSSGIWKQLRVRTDLLELGAAVWNGRKA